MYEATGQCISIPDCIKCDIKCDTSCDTISFFYYFLLQVSVSKSVTLVYP